MSGKNKRRKSAKAAAIEADIELIAMQMAAYNDGSTVTNTMMETMPNDHIEGQFKFHTFQG